MADENTTPAEENKEETTQPVELKGKLLTEQETTDWGNEVTLLEKAPKDESNVLRKELEDNANEEETEDNKTEEEIVVEDEKLPEVHTVEIEDPGEFVPNDYSFEVTTFDEEGKKPKSVKVTSIEQWDELLESEVNLGSSAAVGKAFRAAQKMENGVDKDLAEWESKSQEYKTASEAQAIQEQRNQTIFNEMQYLVDKGELPKLTAEERDTLNWEDEAVRKAHPSIQKHRQLLNYMRKENGVRSKAGLNPLSSVLDAYNAMKLDTRVKADTERKAQVAEARKQAGARISSSSPAAGSAASPRGIAVGRVGDLGRLGQNWQV